jgi:hypothetical protein
MKYSSSVYIKQFKLFRNDLNILMEGWPSGPSFNVAKRHTEAIVPLIASQIGELQTAPHSLQLTGTMKLRSELKELCILMSDDERKKFMEYDAMLDTLINYGTE